MSKKFSKTRKISRKQRSKRNKKTRSNRKRGGDVRSLFGFKPKQPEDSNKVQENPNKATLEGLYEEAINKFNKTEKPLTEKEKVDIRDAIDNLSLLGTKVTSSRDSTVSTDSIASTDKESLYSKESDDSQMSKLPEIIEELQKKINDLNYNIEKLSNEPTGENSQKKINELKEKKKEMQYHLYGCGLYKNYIESYTYNLDNYKILDQLLKESYKIAIAKIIYMEKTGKMDNITSKKGWINAGEKEKCVKECRELGLAKHNIKKGLQTIFTNSMIEDSKNCENEICT